MKKLTVNALSKTYDIIIQKGVLSELADYITPIIRGKRIMVITDSNVAPLYLDDVISAFDNTDLNVHSFIFEAGESSKSLSTVSAIYDELSKHQFDRKDLIIALGGGVCGDISGFVAASYMRGIDFVQIPTTLLSQVDSSVGGKTGVNTSYGKNLVGAFYQPQLVLIDPDTLNTLSDEIFADGMGEVVKYGCIRNAEFFAELEAMDIKDNIEYVIYECLKIKRDVVSEDECENSIRVILNFGHTLGHAIEKLSCYTISHGQAVCIGMAMITRASENAGLTQAGTTDKIVALCNKLNLKTTCDYSLADISENAKNDKKGFECSLNLVLISELGTSFVHKVEKDNLFKFINC